jgi:predicted dehydrogenase
LEHVNPNSLGFAVVGCGRIGRRHVEQIDKVGRLVAACDVVPERARAAAAAGGGAAFDDLTEMLERSRGKVDVVSICTPNGLHCEHALKALSGGYHVLCEKPMALSVHDCGEMIKAAERANRRLFVVKQNRFNPPVEHLKRLLDDGSLGRIFSVHLNCFWNRNDAYFVDTWRGTHALDGGTLYTQFSHFIDLVYWLVGDVRDVEAFTDNYAHRGAIEFEDAGVAILRFHNGAIGAVAFTINSYGRNVEGSITIFAEKGTVKIGGQYLNELEYENVAGLGKAELRAGRGANNYGQYQGSMSNHEDVYRNVRDVLVGGGTMSTIGFEGLKTVEIIDKIYAAAMRHAPRR